MERQQNIGLDVHKDYSVFRILESPGGIDPAIRISHSNGELQRFLMTLPPGSPVAVGGLWQLDVDYRRIGEGRIDLRRNVLGRVHDGIVEGLAPNPEFARPDGELVYLTGQRGHETR
jgi:hypothetical protein